ncbi:integrase [Luteibacter sp. 1214]|uniref:hypothetical protein n=1 Tax=Luteibacter sp. 1214 TaxID=2817735 RepID=UPI0028612797|nr:hypothetical protein [Luteibacter sp. 1214]MDR6643568.1 integrase [Luteibacter sp. 1214]
MFPPSLQSVLQAASRGRHWTLQVGDMWLQSNGPSDTDDMLRAFPDLAEQVRHRVMAPGNARPAPMPRAASPAPRPAATPATPVTAALPVVPERGADPAPLERSGLGAAAQATDPSPVAEDDSTHIPPVAALKPPVAFVPAGEVPENAPEGSDLKTLAAWHMEKYGRRKTGADTRSAIRRTLDLFLAVTGNKESKDVDYRDLQRFATALSKWPKFVNTIQDFKGKSIMEILIENQDEKYPPLKRNSQETHLQHLSAFFNEVIRWKRNGGNPNPVLTINRAKEYGSKDSHPKHAPDEVDWAAPMAKEVMDNVDAPHKFFGTLLVSFTGSRTNEVCQLKRRDVTYVTVRDRKKVQHKVLCMKMTTDADGQHLKGANAFRFVPIPTQVLNLGFEDYLKDLDQLGADEIFPGLQTGSDRPGQSLSRYYNGKLRTDWGVTDKAVTLHCCRHFISTMAAYDQHISPLLLNALFGHSNRPVEGATGGEVLRGKRYVNKASPLDVRNMLDELPFPALNVTPYQRGRFDHYLCHEVGRLKAGMKRKGRVPKAKATAVSTPSAIMPPLSSAPAQPQPAAP